MRPGRLPEDHPLEQQAREELRAKTGTKPEPVPAEQQQAERWEQPAPEKRWG